MVPIRSPQTAVGAGTIYIGNLDLTNFSCAKFDADRKRTYIEGMLTHFLGESDDRLRTPVDQTIYFEPDPNPHLQTRYRLPDLAGNLMSGGWLKRKPDAGTVVTFK